MGGSCRSFKWRQGRPDRKPGERIQFGCSNRIRHTLAPDNSSLTFAKSDELLGHWLCVLSFELQRDWTWDGLAGRGIEVRRVRQFTGEAATVEDEVVGYVQCQKTASRVAPRARSSYPDCLR